jgi:putative ABC transport system permease protein
LATILAIILIFALSLRLRQREIQMIFKLGCSRMTIAQLIAAEILIIVSFSAVLCGIMLAMTNVFSNELVRMAIIH